MLASAEVYLRTLHDINFCKPARPSVLSYSECFTKTHNSYLLTGIMAKGTLGHTPYTIARRNVVNCDRPDCIDIRNEKPFFVFQNGESRLR